MGIVSKEKIDRQTTTADNRIHLKAPHRNFIPIISNYVNSTLRPNRGKDDNLS